MELELSEDQELFRATTAKFLAAEVPLTVVRALEAEPAGFDAGWWRRGAELGWTSMLVPEADGGGAVSDAGLADLVLVAEEMGRLVSPGPLVPVNVVACALGRWGSADQRASILPDLLSGGAIAAWCHAEPERAHGEIGVTATPSADGLVLSGTKAPVEAGAQASHLLVTATAPDGPTQVLVPSDASGLTVTPMDSLDLVRRFATVTFDGVAVPTSSVVGTRGGAADAIEQLLQIAVVLQSAETVGVAAQVLEMTLQYVDDRYSFGRPLSSYQALKHRFADMKMWLEASAGIATAATTAVASGDPGAAEVVSAAASYIGPHATEIVQDCVQMHGGIGVTWEHDIHLYLRRATVNRVMYGTPEDHRERIAVLLGMGAVA